MLTFPHTFKKHIQIIPLSWRQCLLNRGGHSVMSGVVDICVEDTKDQRMQRGSSYLLWIISRSLTDTWSRVWNINSRLFQELPKKLAAEHRGQARTAQEMILQTATAKSAWVPHKRWAPAVQQNILCLLFLLPCWGSLWAYPLAVGAGDCESTFLAGSWAAFLWRPCFENCCPRASPLAVLWLRSMEFTFLQLPS